MEKQWLESIEKLRSLKTINAEYWLGDLLQKNVSILAEGAQGTMLDVDFGTYPFVTSSNTITAGVSTGLGVPPNSIRKVIGIAKAYCTRVGSGPFPSELDNEIGERLRKEGGEFGATTGRARRCGWLDLVQLKYSMMVNGVTDLCLTKIDVLNNFDQISVSNGYQLKDGTHTIEVPFDMRMIDRVDTLDFKGWNQSLASFQHFDQLPTAIKTYLAHIESVCPAPISFLSTGPGRDELLVR